MLKRKTTEKIHERAIYASLVILILILAFLYGKNSYTVPTSTEPTKRTSEPKLSDTAVIKKRSTAVKKIRPDDPNEPWIETLSWSPRLFHYHNFLTQEECVEVVNLGKDGVTRSEVVSDQGSGRVDEYRTSHGLFFTDDYMRDSPLLRDIERRLAEWTHLPIENGEAYYLLRYQIGQYYKPHTDYFSHDTIGERYIASYGNRYATILTYLQTPEEGGSTDFPQVGITVPVKAGDAVLFWDMDPSNEGDPMSQHASLPVTKGEKWAMTKWIRESAFYRWDSQLSEPEKNVFQDIDKEWRRTHYK